MVREPILKHPLADPQLLGRLLHGAQARELGFAGVGRLLERMIHAVASPQLSRAPPCTAAHPRWRLTRETAAIPVWDMVVAASIRGNSLRLLSTGGASVP
jgi:hypothetical protein